MQEPGIHEQALDKTAAYLREMGLGLPASEIVVRRNPWTLLNNAVLVHKGITVSPVPETYAPGTNRSEDVGYGVRITDITAKDNSEREGYQKPTTRRTTIRRAFVHQHPITFDIVDGLYNQTTFEAGELLDAPKVLDRFEVSSVVIRYWLRERRTT